MRSASLERNSCEIRISARGMAIYGGRLDPAALAALNGCRVECRRHGAFGVMDAAGARHGCSSRRKSGAERRAPLSQAGL